MNEQMLSTYLEKLGLSQTVVPNMTLLTQLQSKQHEHIPFENLDVIDGKPIHLGIDQLYQKLVIDGRGGYCFELNGLMHSVLQSFGFEVEKRLGRVHVSGKPSGRGHLVNIVTLEGQQWLVDVGFGSNTPRAPLPLVFDLPLSTDAQTLRFVRHPDFGVMLQAEIEGEWTDLYSLDMSYVCDGDIQYGNHYASTGEDSVFTSNVVAVRRTQSGSNILFNNRLKIIDGKETREMIVDTAQAYNQVLAEFFDIENSVHFDKIKAVLDRHA